MTSSFDLLDDHLCETILSFCDFVSAVQMGRTCHRSKKISDHFLDQWADRVLDELPIHGENHFSNDGGCGVYSKLKDGWHNDFRTKPALIQHAMAELSHLDEHIYVGNEEALYDEGYARFMLQTRGRVDVLDFFDHTPEEYSESDEGWTVKIRFQENYSLSSAAKFISNVMEWGWEVEGVYDEVSNMKDERLLGSVFCIFRKFRNKLQLKFASLRSEFRAPAYGREEEISSLMIQVDDRKIEFFGSKGCQEL